MIKLQKTVMLLGALLMTSVVSIQAQADNTTYTVTQGDTLSGILLKHQIPLTELHHVAEINQLSNIHQIFIGQNLKLTDNSTDTTLEPVVTHSPEEVVVQEQKLDNPVGRTLTVEATAYDGVGLGGMTATGNLIQSTSDKVIAVDPNVIPLGSRVYIPGYGEAIAWDTGGAIKGNIIDLNMSHGDAIQWGRQTVTITILD